MISRIRERAKDYTERNIMWILPLALITGFLWDALTLHQPDDFFENFVILSYVLLSAGTIILLNIKQARYSKEHEGEEAKPNVILLGLLQFAFGNLGSALFILYLKSGAFAGGLIFFGVLIALLIGNEFLRSRYGRMHLHIVVWFALVLTYVSIVLPILVGQMGDIVFLGGVLVSVAITLFLLFLVRLVTYASYVAEYRRMLFSIGACAVVFVSLYFTDNIPPVPLVSQHIGIYHSVERNAGGSFVLTYEDKRLHEFFLDTSFHFTDIDNGEGYCFSSVYAPSSISAVIYHRWEKRNEVTEEWDTVSRIEFAISGGREDGFRGYTQTSQLSEGLWRCNVENENGALIARKTFRVLSPETLSDEFGESEIELSVREL